MADTTRQLRLSFIADTSQAKREIASLSGEVDKLTNKLKGTLGNVFNNKAGNTSGNTSGNTRSNGSANLFSDSLAAKRLQERERILQRQIQLQEANLQNIRQRAQGRLLDQRVALGVERAEERLQQLRNKGGLLTLERADREAKFNNVASVATRSTGSLADAFGGLLNPANLATAAIGFGLSAAIAGLGKVSEEVSRQIERASQRQKDSILSTTAIQNALDIDRGQARGLSGNFAKELQRESGGLVDTAASGKIGFSIIDDYLKNAQKTGQSLSAATSRAAKVSTGLAALAEASGAESGEFQDVLSDITSSTVTVEQLKGRDAFNKTGINKLLVPYLEKKGISTINDSNRSVVLDALDYAVGKAYSPETKAELANTFEGQFKLLNNKLFGVDGAFSIERDLYTNIEGDQNLFTEFTRSAKLLIGQDGLFDQLGKTLNRIIPVDGDLMRDLYDGLKGFNDFLEAVNSFFDEANRLIDKVANSPLGQLVGKVDRFVGNPSDFKFDASRIGLGNNPNATMGLDLSNAPIPYLKEIQSGFNWLTGGFFKPSYAGHLPLFDALALEQRMKPAGSEIVIANTSEYILTQQQMQAMMQMNAIPKYAGESGKMITIAQGAVQVNANAGQSVEQIAYEVVRQLELMIETV